MVKMAVVEEDLLDCDFCGKMYISMDSLLNHVLAHVDRKPYHCKTCGKDFIEVESFMTHVTEHVEYQCDNCEKLFTCEKNLRQHETVEHMDRNSCEMPMLGSAGDCAVKIKEEFPTEDRSFQCDFCEKIYARKQHLLRHMQSHQDRGESKGSLRKKEFGKQQIATYHGIAKNGTKGNGSNVRMRLRANGKKTSRVNINTFHNKSKNKVSKLQGNSKLFKCNQCEENFDRKSSLIQHQWTHSRRRPHRCHLCRQSFSWRSNLLEHKSTCRGDTCSLK